MKTISLQVESSYLGSLLACFCLIAMLSACEFGNVQPSIEVDQRKFDFDSVKEGRVFADLSG